MTSFKTSTVCVVFVVRCPLIIMISTIQHPLTLTPPWLLWLSKGGWRVIFVFSPSSNSPAAQNSFQCKGARCGHVCAVYKTKSGPPTVLPKSMKKTYIDIDTNNQQFVKMWHKLSSELFPHDDKNVANHLYPGFTAWAVREGHHDLILAIFA